MTQMHTAVCDILGCKFPIVLAGMGGPARAELVTAVTQAGGFGFLGMVRESPRTIAREIAAVREQTSLPFGVNLIPAATDETLLEAELQACLDAKIAAVTLFWDLAPQVVKRLRNAGITVVCQIGSDDEADAAQSAGADILIAQGCEAGGHVRGTTPLPTLLSQVLAIVSCPVLVAGGMTNGADLAWALHSGAAGVVMGTSFLATHESFAHNYHKQRIVEAKADDTCLTDIFHRNWPRGAFVRVLENSVTRSQRGDPFNPADAIEIGSNAGRPISLFSTDSPLRTTRGDLEAMALYAGKGSAHIDQIVAAGDLVRRVVSQAQTQLAVSGDCASEKKHLSSPVCYASESSTTYSGMAERSEIVAALEELLQAERAGARVAGQTAHEVGRNDTGSLLTAVQHDEARWCAMLMSALRRLDTIPSRTVGQFYDKAMAIRDIDKRLTLLNRGQDWVMRRLESLIPRIQDDVLRTDLATMRKAHSDNIQLTEELLVARSKT